MRQNIEFFSQKYYIMQQFKILNENMAEKKQRSGRKYLDTKMGKRVVQAIAKQMKGKGLTMDELMDVGMEGIVRASEHYDDVLKGCKPSSYKNTIIFHAYAVWWIRQAMRQAIEEREKDRKS